MTLEVMAAPRSDEHQRCSLCDEVIPFVGNYPVRGHMLAKHANLISPTRPQDTLGEILELLKAMNRKMDEIQSRLPEKRAKAL